MRCKQHSCKIGDVLALARALRALAIACQDRRACTFMVDMAEIPTEAEDAIKAWLTAGANYLRPDTEAKAGAFVTSSFVLL